MRTLALGVLLAPVILVLGPATTVSAQDAGEGDGARVREEIAITIEKAARKVISLAEEMPAESYDWRPAEGVRSVSEVFMHVAGTNWWFPTVVGGQPPATSGVTAAYGTVPPLERVTEKEDVVAALQDSFAFVIEFVRTAPADRLDVEIDMFGQPSTVRGLLIETSVHLHEHLGQSITYARLNGVKPPWS